jgi:hypothetical protein
VTIKLARADLSHSVFTGISREHLDRLVAELAEPFQAAREGRLHHRRGDRNRRRLPGAGRPQTPTLPDRVLCALVWPRLALPHQALAVIYGVSGKKKQNTIKATVASDAHGRPLWSGAIRPGRMHDQTAVKTDGIDDLLNAYPDVKFLVDSGYRGLAKDHPEQVVAPPLKPGKGASPDEIAAYETARSAQSSQRIPAEHAIAAIKWWRTLQRFTGRRDLLPEIIRAVAGLASDRAAAR